MELVKPGVATENWGQISPWKPRNASRWVKKDSKDQKLLNNVEHECLKSCFQPQKNNWHWILNHAKCSEIDFESSKNGWNGKFSPPWLKLNIRFIYTTPRHFSWHLGYRPYRGVDPKRQLLSWKLGQYEWTVAMFPSLLKSFTSNPSPCIEVVPMQIARKYSITVQDVLVVCHEISR